PTQAACLADLRLATPTALLGILLHVGTLLSCRPRPRRCLSRGVNFSYSKFSKPSGEIGASPDPTPPPCTQPQPQRPRRIALAEIHQRHANHHKTRPHPSGSQVCGNREDDGSKPFEYIAYLHSSSGCVTNRHRKNCLGALTLPRSLGIICL